MLIMSIKTFKNKFKKFEMFEAILDGLDDAEEGKTKEGISSLKDLKIKYDL